MNKRWKKIFLYSGEGIIGASIVCLLIFISIFSHWLTPYPPEATSFAHRLEGPSQKHWFGTDEMGRDLFSRVVSGSRPSIGSSLIVILLAGVGGSLIGLVAGFFGSFMDTVIMRLTDMFVGFPALILAVAVAAALGPGLVNGMIAVAIVWWPGYARMARATVLSIKNLLFIEAAEALGSPRWKTMLVHILPNSLSPLLVKVTTDIGAVILYIAGLGFLGLGAQPPSPEWGTMVADARVYLIGYWWFPVFPGVALMLSVIGFNLLGDAFQKVFDVSLLEP